MPRENKSGPKGQGPMTGKKMGCCAGNDSSGYMESWRSPRLTRGFRGGRSNATGMGMRRNMPYTLPYEEDLAPIKEEERNYLIKHSERLKRTINEIEQRIKVLDKE